MKKLDEKLDELFSNLEFKEFTCSDVESKLTPQEKIHHNKIQSYISQIKELLENTMLRYSENAVNINLVFSIFDDFKITRETIKTEPFFSLGLNKIEPIFELFDIISSPDIRVNYYKLIIASERYFQSESTKVNCDLIASVFFDYLYIIKIKEIYNQLDLEIKSEISLLLNDLEATIQNAHSFWDIKNVKEEIGKKSIIHKGKASPLEYHFSSNDIKSIEESISKFLEIETELLKGKLTKETIGILIDIIKIYKSINLADKTLERLSDSFSDKLKVPLSKKALFLNEALVIYGHPVGITLFEADILLNKNNNYTEDNLKRQIIRNIKSLVNNLK
jgi:hypothetical protein